MLAQAFAGDAAPRGKSERLAKLFGLAYLL
jgi:hypothetical protein